jgi:hypothetical protein
MPDLIPTLTAQLLNVRGLRPYRLSINHNVGPPHNVACPLQYDWRHGRAVGIETNSRDHAIRWIRSALLFGYRVERLDRTGWNVLESADLKAARQRAVRAAEREAMTPEQRKAEDDSIPF